MEPIYETEDLRIPGEADRLKPFIKGNGIYAVTLDETLPPWGAKLMPGKILLLGSAAKRDNFLFFPDAPSVKDLN